MMLWFAWTCSLPASDAPDAFHPRTSHGHQTHHGKQQPAPPAAPPGACLAHPELIKVAEIGSCQAERWLSLVRSIIPCASTFFDVGANRGYMGAKLFGLWRPQLSLNPNNWWSAHVAIKQWEPAIAHPHCGHCRDCQYVLRELPVTCSDLSDDDDMRVFSFDASGVLVKDFNSFADSERHNQTQWPWLKRNWLKRNWVFPHLAISDRIMGPTLLEQRDTESQQIGNVRTSTNSSGDDSHKQIVKTTTLDTFAFSHGILTLDVLKVDVEGGNGQVLRGATRLLREANVAVVMFEHGSFAGNHDLPLNSSLRLLEMHNFSCYFAGRVSLVKITGCWDDRMEWSHPESWLVSLGQVFTANIVCSSHPRIVKAFDDHCVPTDSESESPPLVVPL